MNKKEEMDKIIKKGIWKKLEKYLERGHLFRSAVNTPSLYKLKKWGVISYNERKPHFDIDIKLYNKIKEEEGL